MAGGGESSIQYTSSSSVNLACWAKTCATLFPLLLTHQIAAQCKPPIKWWISSTTLPKSELSSAEEEIAWETLLLSPSMINLWNPASTANSKALRQARNSASSPLESNFYILIVFWVFHFNIIYKILRNAMSTTFSQQILCSMLLRVIIGGVEK